MIHLGFLALLVYVADMVLAWLQKKDKVLTQTGEPTWTSLVEALEKKGHSGVAAEIKKDKTGGGGGGVAVGGTPRGAALQGISMLFPNELYTILYAIIQHGPLLLVWGPVMLPLHADCIIRIMMQATKLPW